MKATEVALRRIHNSHLAGTLLDAPDEVVRWHVAMQAQDYGPAKWSVGQRSKTLVDSDVDRALAAGSILRTHVLRPTWHFVARDDIRWLLSLTGPRVQQHNGPRYRQLGLDPHTIARSAALIGAALEGGNELKRSDLAAVLDAAGIDRSGQRLPHILMHCELEGLICSGARQGKQHTYALLDERVPQAPPFDRDGALIELTRRYLDSHGPATVYDLAWWSSLTITDIRKALDALSADGGGLEQETIDGTTFWSVAADRRPNAHGADLLHTYDELVVGYTRTRFFGDPHASKALAAWRDRSLPNAIVLLNGRLAGHWRRAVTTRSVTVEVSLYDDPSPGDGRRLETTAARLGRFLERRVALEIARL